MQQRIRLLLRQLQNKYLKANLPPFNYERLFKYLTNISSIIKNYSSVHQSLVILTIFILINNVIVAHAASQIPNLPPDVVVSDPYEIGDTVRLLRDYTPLIDEDPDMIAQTLEERVSGSFLSTNPLIATEPGQSDEPDPLPSPNSQVADRSKEVKYTVAIGDTLSGIGSKFDLKVASIKVKNNISDVDTLKPGQELLIPVDDLSDKAIKAAEDRKVASQKLAETKQAAKKIVARAQSGGYGLVVPIRHNGISRGLISGVHTGIDYRANVGTQVSAAQDGVVVVADSGGWNGGYGKYVVLSHPSGRTTYYAHLSNVLVRSGQHVSQGEVVGLSGNTGRSTGPHLHFELRVNGRAVNPF
jgi:LysM repeat protein